MNERDQDKANDHQKQPCAVFTEMYKLPAVPLMGIDPYGGESSYIFGKPNEECDQAKSQKQRHAMELSIWTVVNPCWTKDSGYKNKKQNADVLNEVMRKEVSVNEDSQRGSNFHAGIACIAHIQNSRDT